MQRTVNLMHHFLSNPQAGRFVTEEITPVSCCVTGATLAPVRCRSFRSGSEAAHTLTAPSDRPSPALGSFFWRSDKHSTEPNTTRGRFFIAYRCKFR
ncbi:uncharacterized [Tachysurus ichikawai]